MKNIFSHIRIYAVAHKVITTIFVLVAAYRGYKAYASLTSTSTAPRYVVASVTKGTVISVVSGSWISAG